MEEKKHSMIPFLSQIPRSRPFFSSTPPTITITKPSPVSVFLTATVASSLVLGGGLYATGYFEEDTTPNQLELAQKEFEKQLKITREKAIQETNAQHQKVVSQLNDEISQHISEKAQLEASVIQTKLSLKDQFKQKVNDALRQLQHENNTTLAMKETALEDAAQSLVDQKRHLLEAEFRQRVIEAIDSLKGTVNEQLEEERQNRLMTISQLYSRVLHAEQTSLSNVAYKAVSSRTHALTVCLHQLMDSLTTRRPFKQVMQDLIDSSAPIHSDALALDLVRGNLNALDNIHSLSQNSNLIEMTLSHIPDTVSTQGVYTLDDLRTGFRQVRTQLHRISRVPSDASAGLWTHLWSNICSFFTIYPSEPIVSGPCPEKTDGNTTFLDLVFSNTFVLEQSNNPVEIIAHQALSHLLEGDLASAVEKVEQLEGIHALVAQQWLEAARARLLVETCVNTAVAYTNSILSILKQAESS